MNLPAMAVSVFRSAAVVGVAAVAIAAGAAPAVMQARLAENGQVEITEDDEPVLRYNYRTTEPGERLKAIAQPNLIYARPRSDYIHPLYGFDGEELTADFPIEHPHHRGIYWAWPETKYGDEMGDLHALQRVFARPTGRPRLHSGDRYAEVAAENVWKWEDREPIVKEKATIRAYRSGPTGRFVDLTLRFEALKEGISIARRGTDAYGGLNIRMNAVSGQEIVFHTDAASASPRRAWGYLSGVFAGGHRPTALVVFQHPANPDYPGDWVKFPELHWFQPTFPTSGSRYALRPGRPLVLRFRLWITAKGVANEGACAAVWDDFAANRSPRSPASP